MRFYTPTECAEWCDKREERRNPSCACAKNSKQAIFTLITVLGIAFLLMGCETGGKQLAAPEKDDSTNYNPNPAGVHTNATAKVSDSFRPSPLQIGITQTNLALRAYDMKFINSIENQWNKLVDSIPEPYPREHEEVVVNFHLHQDGQVSDLRVVRQTASEREVATCRHAILDCSPFEPWPQEIRQLITSDFREISFKFAFEQ